MGNKSLLLSALTESEIVVTDARFQFSVLLLPSLNNDKVGFINVFSCKYLIINNNNYNNNNIYFTRVNPSAEAVINGCPRQLKKITIKGKITITDRLSEKCKNYVQCR